MKVKRSAKRQTIPTKDVTNYIERILSASDQELASILRLLDVWRYLRGDLHSWIPVLDRFDALLAEIIESYEIHKLQTNDFTPKTKELVLEILRMQRLLLEHCTNRKLFASYDRLSDLLLTSDIDVLHASLQVLLRPSQQYLHSTPFEPGQSTDTIQRLLILARGWERLESRGSLAFIASSEEYTPPEEPVTITFYPTTGNKGAAMTVDLSNLDPNSPHDQLAQLGEEHGIPLEDRFAALCKLRLAHMTDLATRRKLLEIRLYAMGSYVCLAPEDAAQSNFYLYEPEIVPQIAELLVLTNDVGDEVRSAALQALDSCARHRRGLTAVTTALGTNVGHGLLMTLLRAVIKSEHSYELVDAVLQHLGLIVGVSTHNNMLLSAGVVPLLLDFSATQNPRRDNYIPRVCGILDQIVFSINQGMSVFSNANGLNIFVHRIKEEIDMDWVLTPSEIVSEDSVLTYAASPLRSFLRNVSRLMSATGGTEGLRNLVDTDLPKSLRRIFENPQKYSDRVFSLSINVMATFVHNEPTSLSILQEMQLPQTLFAKLEESTPRSFEVLAAIPGAVGAVCLNSSGLKYTTEHPMVLTNLIDLAISPDLKDTPSERDYIVTIGTALDELVRHHPSLRAGVQEKVFALLPEAIEKARTFEPETPSDYILDRMSIETPAKEAPTNPHLDRLGKIFRLIEGVFHNTSVCKDFIQQGGITELLSVADLPCVPIKFGATEAALHLSHVFRIISEQDHILLIGSMISSIEEALTLCRRFWQGDDLHEAWMRIHRGEASDEDRDEFKRLRGVAIRLTYMSESFLGSAFSHSRIATSLIKALRASKTFVPDIGALHRAAFREHGVLQNSTPTAASLSSVTEGENEAESGAKFLATRLNAILAKFWKSAIKLLYVKRNPEPAHKAEASALANSIAQILVHHLELPPEGARGTKVDTVAIGLTSVLLFDERAHEGHLNTLLFLAFEKKGGVICLRDAMARLVDSMDEAYAEGKKDDVPTTAGNRVAVMVLASLVASRALLESPQTLSLVGAGNFSPPDVLVKVRHDLFPLIRRIWESNWLPTAPTPLVKYAAKALLTIMEAKAENPVSAPAPQPIVPIPAIARAPATADPARVEQLVEMGFDRSAADLALVRARNNVAAAAELILSMPHLFQNLPAPEPAPAPPGEDHAEGPGNGEAGNAQETDAAEATNATTTEASEATAEEEESPMEVDTPDLREALNHLREELKPTLPQRALEILDQAEDLVFDLLPAFEGRGISFLLDQALLVGESYEPAREGSVSARLRLVVVSLKSSDVVLSDNDLERAKRLLSVLPFETSPRPRWTPAALLLGELVLINASPVTEVKIGDDPNSPVTKDGAFDDILTRVAKACQLIAEDKEASRDDLLSAMRLLVVITRQQSIASECLPVLLTAFSSPSPKLRGCHPLLAMIVRHAFEDKTNLAVVMRKEIHEWMSPARNKVSDVSHFVRQLRQVALRDPTEFVATVDATCTLNDPTPPQSVFHIRSKQITKEAAEGSDPFRESPVSPSARTVMDQLLTELSKAIDQHENENAQAYSGLLMALITEVIGSYIPSKQLFLSSLRTTVKAKGISTVIDWMCDITLTDIAARGTRTPEALRRLTLSGWAASLIVSLCSDITPTADMKDMSEDLISVRKTVLDALVRAIKDCTNLTDLDARYGRLCALAELVFRLLVSRVSVVQHTPDESGTHMAKTMIEKNFVSTLTAAAGEVDLNYPNVRSVLGSILRALEHLSKMSIKWGKAEKPKDEIHDDLGGFEEESEDESDIDMDEEETPDLYRNSALGMGMPRDGDSEDEDEDDEDEEDMMQFGGDDVIDEMMDEDEDTEPSSEDEDMDDDMVHEDDWTDEDDEGDEEDGDGLVEQEVILGPPGDDDEEVAWDREGDLVHEHDSFMTDEGDFDDDGDPYGEDFYGDEEDDEMDIDDGEEYDEIEMLEPLPTATEAVFYPQTAAAWGWEQGTTNEPPLGARSRLLEDEASAMFGGRRPAPAGPAQHPLITPPTSAPVPAARRLPRGLSTVNGIQELIASLEGNASQEALRLLEQLIAQTRNTGGEAFRVDLAQDAEGAIALTLGGRSFHIPPPPAPAAADQDVTFEFVPKPTNQRWLEEMAIVPGGYSNTYTTRLVTHIVNRLMPEAKRLAEEEAEKQRKADEEEAERQRKEDEEREAAEKQKREEELESAAAIALPESRVSPPPPEVAPDASGDVEMAAEPEVVEEAPVESLARTIISIHGRDVDITDTGIDLEFLQALPDDMRADVVEQYMREHNRDRRPAADIPEPSSEISREFLDALPPEIRAEVLMQEALESARRSAPEAEDDLAGGPMGEAFPDLAGELQAIGSGMAAIANLLGGPQITRVDARGAGGVGGGLARITGALGGSSMALAKRSHREAIQLLDKNGIACLVRLLFFPEVFKRGYLFRVLVNLCENTNTRSDLLNLLLSVVQEGSGDLPAVDRSFQQMSLRAISTPKVTPKTPKVPETPGPSSAAPLFAHLQSEHIPTFIAQRCFEALAYIVSSNQHAVMFFLTEHEQAVGLKKILSKKDKGKGKEKVIPQTKFPIVILLGLLDRPVLLKASSLMESLTTLLATITKPLSGLKRLEEANKVEAEAPPSEVAEAPTAPTTATPAQATTTVATLTGDGVPAAPHVSPPTTVTKPPVIPHSVTRLVVNCLTVGECTSKTFSQTLALMQNLSHIPDTKDIILRELQTRAQELGKTIQQELTELAAALREEGEIDATTLAKFSPQTSSQSQLLRLLKTIDYLHISKVDSEPGEELTDQEKAVGQIFEALDFDPMWKQLGECLSIVESGGDTDQIATVLLPLVEALMVMCKYRSRASREGSLPPVTPLAEFPPSADLFVSFTTAHRKVLNAIVRKNAALLSGSFSLLVRNSRVLEFDNKRAWFQLKLKRKRDQAVPVLHLNIRRQYVFEDSFHALQRKSGNEIKFGKLSVKFYNEDGIDAGGVTREWYSVLAQQIFDPNFALFEPVAADKQTYQPNKASAINVDHLAYFKFVGRVIGKAVIDNRLLDAYFNRAFYKQILGRTVDMRDLESIDPEYHKSLQWMLDNDITGVIDQEFTIEDDEFGEKKVVELKEGGAKIPVTEENKQEYVRLVVSYRLDNSIKDQIKAFLDGFYDIIPRQLVQIFEPDQLELLISGITTVDVDELKNATQLGGWKNTDPEISWFWRALRSFSQEERARFLMFVTSSSRVPLGGFNQLQGASGVQPFQIQKLYANEGSLPQASTCFNLLLLPKYESYEQLREKLLFAIYETSGFGKA